MTVSFCVIAYNEEKTLKSLFSDIRSQDFPHDSMEVILVNGMSTDCTRRLMEEFAQENNGFMKVTVIDNPKKIQSAGWNIALRESVGDVILRIDAHTKIPKTFVSQNVAFIEEGEYVVGGPRPNITDLDTAWSHTLLLAETSMFGSSIAPYRKGHHKSYVKSVFHGAYRREVFEKAGFFNENLGRTEDNEMHYRIRQAGYRICYSPNIISYQHTRSTWRGMIKQKYGNGYWIGLTLGICPKCFSIYHFVPFGFVLGLCIALIFACYKITIPIIVLGIVYLVVDLIMSAVAMLSQKFYWQYCLLPLVFLSLHLAYGIGTLVGMLKMPVWKFNLYRRLKDDNYDKE